MTDPAQRKPTPDLSVEASGRVRQQQDFWYACSHGDTAVTIRATRPCPLKIEC
jgi:hypothetical protein